MKNTSKIAMGAMISALCLALMLSTAILPFLSYAIPMIAGALIMLMVIECDKLWALFVYVCVAILSLLIVSDKSSGIAFLCYFGYYPILKAVLESKTSRVIERIIKYANINVVVITAYFLMLKFFGIDLEGVEFLAPYVGKWYTYIMLFAFTSFFFYLYDLTLTKVVYLYTSRFRKKFRKLFK